MNEPFLLGLIVGAIAVLVVARIASRAHDGRGLPRVEAKIDALLKHHGVRFDPYSDVPPTVIEALHRGNKIEAIKAYRAATGTGLKEAKEYVEEIQRRASPRVY